MHSHYKTAKIEKDREREKKGLTLTNVKIIVTSYKNVFTVTYACTSNF